MQNNFYNNFEKYTKIALPGVEMPSFDVSDEIQKKYNLKDKNPTELLKALINEGWIRREINKKPNKEEYKERVKKELDVVCKIEAQQYFLIIWDIINYCRKNEIPTGLGRGSASSSVILYLINVTNIDPIKHSLIFERFISADRVDAVEENGKKYFLSLPDVDLDISANRRCEVIQYLKEKYQGRFCKISNYSTEETKVSLKNTAKLGFNYKESEINEITALLLTAFGKNKSFEDTIKEVPKFAQWAKENEKCVEIAKKLRSLMVSFGVHASGYVISNQKLENYMSTFLDKEGEIVSSYDMSVIESLAIKVDLLGLKTLDVIDIALKEMGIKYYDFLDNPDIIGFNIDNPAIYEYFQENKYPKGIFQLESGTANNCMNKVKPNSIDEVSSVTSLARPGSFQYIDKYAEVKFGKKQLEHRHPILDKILGPTQGYIIYQEQIMAIMHELYQFSLKDANKLRKGIGKKKREEVDKWKNAVYKRSDELKIDKSVTDFYWGAVTAAADYSFCKSHAFAYSYLSVITAYLKYTHPQEFFLALLKNAKNESKTYLEISEIFKELPHFGIQLLPPDLIKSQEDFSIENKNIRCGIGNIKGISDKGLKTLQEFKNKEYPNKFELFIQAANSKISIGVLSALIQAGVNMCENISSRNRFVLEAQTWNLLTDREKIAFLKLGANYNYDILQLLQDCFAGKIKNEKGDPLIKESRANTIRRDYAKPKEIYEKNKKFPKFCNFYYEKSLLGFNYSVKLLDCFPNDTDLTNTELAKEVDERELVNVVGFVKESFKGKSRKGSQYMRIIVEDEYGECTFIMGENGVARWNFKDKPLPSEGDIIYCSGIKSNDAFFLNDFENFDQKIYLKFGELAKDKRKKEKEQESEEN